MMKTGTKIKPTVRNINKPGYVAFLLAGIYFLIQKDISQAASFWGIALIFDPFDVEMPFTKRPVYQQVWLLVHLSVTLALFGWELIAK